MRTSPPRFHRASSRVSAPPPRAWIRLSLLIVATGFAAWAAQMPAIAADRNATALDEAATSASAPARHKDKATHKTIEKGERQGNDSKRAVPPKTKAASSPGGSAG